MSTAAIKIKGLTNIFDGRYVHNHIDLDIQKGEVLVLLGGSGTGKTTLLRSIVGLVTPQSGHCYYEDQDIGRLSKSHLAKLRTKIAYVFQGGALFDSLSVEENLEFPLIEHTKLGLKERKNLVAKSLERFALGAIEKLNPIALSGGMLKRLGIARALMLEPEIVLFDEPTAGLDPANIARMNHIILDLKKDGITSVVVTHDAQCAKVVADRFAYLANGKIAALQTRADFERNPEPQLQAYFQGNVE